MIALVGVEKHGYARNTATTSGQRSLRVKPPLLESLSVNHSRRAMVPYIESTRLGAAVAARVLAFGGTAAVSTDRMTASSVGNVRLWCIHLGVKVFRAERRVVCRRGHAITICKHTCTANQDLQSLSQSGEV